MSGGRPTLSLTRRTPLKSRKNITATTTKKKNNNGNLVVSNSNNSHNSRAWVDTVTDLNQYKPSQEELDQRKVSRKSNNKLLAKVALADRRLASLDPEKQRLIGQQILLEQRKHPNQNVEAILARSEQVMEICQGILNGETITPSYPDLDNRPVTREREAAEAVAVTEPEPVKEKEEASEAVTLVTAAQPTVTPYMNSAALNEIAGELLITVRELREELLQEREARERLEREVVQQRELLSELAREVVRLQIFCSGERPEAGAEEASLSDQLQSTKIV